MTKASQAPGTFILSFDCEGKFGMADHLTPELEARLTNRQNTAAYRRILATLDRHQLRGTFAFVGACTLHPDEYPQWQGVFPHVPVAGRDWLETFFRDAGRGAFDGWLNPEPLSLVRQAGGHEVATHGFSHLPLAESVIGAENFDRELAAATRLARARGDTIRTIVYPRNQVGHTARLGAHGLTGYRAALNPQWRGLTRRASNVLAEFNVLARSQSAGKPAVPIAVPSGHILNFHHNLARRIVPRAVTIARWRRMLEHAAQTGGVVHLWSHPHNFLTDPGLEEVFAGILGQAAVLLKEGRLRNLTMEEYCAEAARP